MYSDDVELTLDDIELTMGRTAYWNKDYPTAIKRLRPLAKAGCLKAQEKVEFTESEKVIFTEAQYTMGLVYLNGKGTMQNFRLAYVWFLIAEDGEHERAKEKRQWLKKQLTPAEEESIEPLIFKFIFEKV